VEEKQLEPRHLLFSRDSKAENNNIKKQHIETSRSECLLSIIYIIISHAHHGDGYAGYVGEVQEPPQRTTAGKTDTGRKMGKGGNGCFRCSECSSIDCLVLVVEARWMLISW